MNNIKQYFNFSNKLKHSIVMEKKVDERVIDVKEIRVKKVNWLPFFFTFLYPIFTQKYRTKGFAKDICTYCCVFLKGLSENTYWEFQQF